jgi:N-acetylmuramoyl-L-alanine amidase
MKICIDPGHGGKDTGAVGFGIMEKDVNLDISLRLKELLKNNGLEVFMTRDTDDTISLKKRSTIINNLDCDLVVSIHNNSFTEEKGNGSEVIYPHKSEEGKKMAQYVLDELGKIGLKKRRIYYRLNKDNKDYYYIIRNTRNTTIIIECAFISNKENNQLLQKEDFKQKIAQAICNAIVKYREEIQYNTHWAREYFDKIQSAGLVIEEHDLSSKVTWGEFSTVLARLLEKIIKKSSI